MGPTLPSGRGRPATAGRHPGRDARRTRGNCLIDPSRGYRRAATRAAPSGAPSREQGGPRGGDLAGSGVPVGRDLRRERHELRPLQRGGRPRRAVPVRRGRQGDPGRADRGRRLRLALLPAHRAARPALRLPRARPARPGPGPALQPEQAADGPLRQGDQRRDRVEPVAVRLQLRRPGLAQRRRLRGVHAEERRDHAVLRLGGRPPPRHPLQRDVHLRGARQGPHPAAPRHPRGAARHVRRARPPGGHRAPHQARRHRDRADAGAPVRAGQHACRTRACATTGATTPWASSPRTPTTRRTATTASRCRSSSRWSRRCTPRASR